MWSPRKRGVVPTGTLRRSSFTGQAVWPRTTLLRQAQRRVRGKGGYKSSARVGDWRSLVARTLGVGEVTGSNPVSPTRAGEGVRVRRTLSGVEGGGGRS